MEMSSLQTLFDIHGLTAIITGGSGQLGRSMALGLAQAGVPASAFVTGVVVTVDGGFSSFSGV
jgi:hypothetical protein